MYPARMRISWLAKVIPLLFKNSKTLLFPTPSGKNLDHSRRQQGQHAPGGSQQAPTPHPSGFASERAQAQRWVAGDTGH